MVVEFIIHELIVATFTIKMTVTVNFSVRYAHKSREYISLVRSWIKIDFVLRFDEKQKESAASIGDVLAF